MRVGAGDVAAPARLSRSPKSDSLGRDGVVLSGFLNAVDLMIDARQRGGAPAAES
jgi:hypothetical protein